jgi:K+-transporting ATPase KdpF subunit
MRRQRHWQDYGYSDHNHHGSIFRSDCLVRDRMRPIARCQMTFDDILGLVMTAGLLVYLTYALLRPERL